MTFVRTVLRNLVDKRLWPVALLMVVALVAIPLIGGDGGDAGAGEDALPVAPAGAAGGTPAVELVGPASVRRRAGKVVDPFRRPAKAKQPSSSTSTGTDETGAVSGGSGGSGGSGRSTSGSTTAGTTAGSTGGTSDSATAGAASKSTTVESVSSRTYDLSKVADVRFRKQGGPLKRIDNLAPLSSLPSEKEPIVMFAGALRNKDVARFLILARSGLTSGNGSCKIKDDGCVSIDMEIGDHQVFRVKGVQYELDLVAIDSAKVAGSASRTKVRFGGPRASERALSRLKPLGGAVQPALLYLGVYSDGKRALFVLGPDAEATSDGDCMDGPACRIIGLRRGETGHVSVGSRSYGIDVSIVGGDKRSSAVARDGRQALRAMLRHGATAAALSSFRYAQDRGVVTRTK